MPSESRWRIYRRDPPRMGVHCRGCLRGFASRSMRLLSPPFPCSLQFRRRSGKGCVTKPNFVPISNPILPLNSNLSNIGIKLIAAYFTRGNFTEFRWKFHFFFFHWLSIREAFLSNRKFVESFAFFSFFWKLVRISRIFHEISVIFLDRVWTEDWTTMRANFFFEGLDRGAGRFFKRSPTEGGWNAKTWKRTRRSNDQ